MEYSFNLEWSELSEDLRESKINEVIAYGFANSDYVDGDGEPLFADLDLALEDPGNRERAENYCSCHFPLYF